MVTKFNFQEDYIFYNVYNNLLSSLTSKSILDKTYILTNDINFTESILYSVFTKDIKPSDKIYIDKKCSFPALLLNRLSVNVTRTTDVNKADVVVIDNNSYDFDKLIICYKSDEYKRFYISVERCNNDLNIGFDIFKKKLKENCSIDIDDNDPNLSLCFTLKNSDLINKLNKEIKLVSTSEFIEYVNSQLPVLSNDELDSIVSMIGSKDAESIKTGIDMLQYYNISDCKLQILGAVFSNKMVYNSTSQNSVSKSYLFYRLKVSKFLLENYSSSYTADESNVLNILILFRDKNMLPEYCSVEQLQNYFSEKIYNLIMSDYKIKLILDNTKSSFKLIPNQTGDIILPLPKGSDTNEKIKNLVFEIIYIKYKFYFDICNLTLDINVEYC